MIELQAKDFSMIKAEGEKSFPNECCGILLGHAQRITELLPVDNHRENEEQFHRFLIEPDDMLKAEREADARGLDVLGFYHSHPDAPAKPSEYDREHALPFYIYVIVSVKDGAADEMTAWSLSPDRAVFVEEEYEVV